jgi:hypothetical protein
MLPDGSGRRFAAAPARRLNRFAGDRAGPATGRAILKRNGVRVVPTEESIAAKDMFRRIKAFFLPQYPPRLLKSPAGTNGSWALVRLTEIVI